MNPLHWEKWQFITPDGDTHTLHNPPRKSVLIADGTGNAEYTISEQRGPFQHGTTPSSIRLNPRRMTFSVRFKGRNRDEYWTHRQQLDNWIRPNRTALNYPTSGTLRKQFVVNNAVYTRDIDCMIGRAPTYNIQPDRWDQFSFTAVLDFLAHNPVFYDPTQYTVTASSCSSSLVFPFGFPLTLGTTECSASLTYSGSWFDYPTIELDGPLSEFFIRNEATDLEIRFGGYTIGSGETVTIDLSYGNKTVENNFGTSLIDYVVEESSDLANFALHPDPTAPNGINNLSIYYAGGGSGTAVRIKYYHRYIGLHP